MKAEERELILVVDDHDAGLYHKTRTLRSAGYTVLQSRTGKDALRKVREKMPRLVLLDVRLPDIDGWEV
ncbi:MAG TPA: response regulator, partial [Candidatus Eisenbacteria bacterium]|nr:response regulator [Candidatus Eisenbacteria bacterium]